MKKIIILSFLFYTCVVIAQNPSKISPFFNEDMLQWHLNYQQLQEQNQTVTRTTPTPPVINLPEFCRSQGVLIAYPLQFGIPYTLIAAMSQIVKVTTAIPASYYQNSIRNTYTNNGVNMNNVDFIVGNIDSYWTRDFGPWFIIDGNDQFGVADFTYNRDRTNDDHHMQLMANYLNINHFDFPLVHTGGNYMTDGYGTSASTDLVFQENDLTESEIRQLCSDYLGIDNYHFTIDPQGDYIAHIDCWGKFLDVDKVLIAQLPTGANRYQEYEDVANYFANATSSWGNKYQVYRVFEPGSMLSNARTPYTNSLILNDHVFVPITGSSYDADAIECYQNAMPGYTIVPVMELSSRQWLNTDALHCRTHEIVDLGLLLIRHYPILGCQPYQSSFTITADIMAYSGQSIISDSVQIIYRSIHENDTTGWNIAPMYPLGGKTWEGQIIDIQDTCEIQYYLKAADLSGRKEFHPFIGEPDPHIFTVAPNPDGHSTAISSFTNDNSISIIPNPAHSSFTLSVANAKSFCIFNAIGEKVWQQESLNDNKYVIQCEHWKAGTYFVKVVQMNGKVCTRTIIIQ